MLRDAAIYQANPFNLSDKWIIGYGKALVTLNVPYSAPHYKTAFVFGDVPGYVTPPPVVVTLPEQAYEVNIKSPVVGKYVGIG
jgi:hypothetical protein